MKKSIKILTVCEILLSTTFYTYSQTTVLGNSGVTTDYLGWDNLQSFALRIEQQNTTTPQNINFSTNGTQKMTILGSSGTDDGFVGIGIASPLERLVINGNFHLLNQTSTIKINANRDVFIANPVTSSIYIGIGSGVSAGTAAGNTFIGESSGNTVVFGGNTYVGFETGMNTAGGENTYVGSLAGRDSWSTISVIDQANCFFGNGCGQNNFGSANCFYGRFAGQNNGDPAGNNPADFCTFIGLQAGTINKGPYNVFVGAHSGETCTSGNSNTAIGTESAFNTTSGEFNSFVGYKAGLENTIGRFNTFLGTNADVPFGGATQVNNSAAIGANTIVVSDNTMILGNNDVSVGIGMSGLTPSAKLHVQRNNSSGVPVTPIGAIVENFEVSSAGAFNASAYGIQQFITGSNKDNYGVYSEASGAITNRAGDFQATGKYKFAHASDNYINIGVSCNAGWGNYNYGLMAYAINPTPATSSTFNFNVGVYGQATTNTPFPPGAPPAAFTGSWAGYFNGDLGYTGSFGVPSDANLKTNIQEFSDAGSILNALNVYTYYFDTLKFKDHINFSGSLQFGLLAQEVEAVAPNLVINSTLPPKMDATGNVLVESDTVKMLNYMELIPLLIRGHKDQKSLLDSLSEVLNELQATINNCCGSNRGGIQDIILELI